MMFSLLLLFFAAILILLVFCCFVKTGNRAKRACFGWKVRRLKNKPRSPMHFMPLSSYFHPIAPFLIPLSLPAPQISKTLQNSLRPLR